MKISEMGIPANYKGFLQIILFLHKIFDLPIFSLMKQKTAIQILPKKFTWALPPGVVGSLSSDRLSPSEKSDNEFGP